MTAFGRDFVYRFLLEHALTIATDKVALLARLTLLEGQRRSLLLERTPLVRVLLFAPRVSMPPGDRDDIPAMGASIAYAWFVRQRGYCGPPPVQWLRQPLSRHSAHIQVWNAA